MHIEWTTGLAVAAVFLVAGFGKGIVGIGLPIFAVSLLSHIIGIREAIYITLAPAMLTSLAQAIAGPALKTIFKRLWPLLLVGGISIGIATQLGLKGDKRILAFIVGSLIIVYSAVSLAKFKFPRPGKYEPVLTPLLGLIGGTLGGMSGMFAMPVVPYLQTLGFNRNELIQAIAVWFVAGALIMLTVVGANRSFTPNLVMLSVIAAATSLTGIWFGGRVRGRMSEELFVRVFLIAFLFFGAAILLKAF